MDAEMRRLPVKERISDILTGPNRGGYKTSRESVRTLLESGGFGWMSRRLLRWMGVPIHSLILIRMMGFVHGRRGWWCACGE